MTKTLLVKSQGTRIPELSREIPANGIITVGSEPSSIIVLTGETIAPEQFVIVCEDERMMLLCRVDGTSINGEEMPQGSLHDLQPGDVVAVGDYTLVMEETSGESGAFSGALAEAENAGETEIAAAKNSAAASISTNPAENSQKSLKDILEGLRAEEKFYFQIETDAGGDRRVYVETEEMWLGWTAEGECALTVETGEIAAARAQIRKDWSGVVLYPLQSENVWLNNEPLSEPHRLKNDDRLYLTGLSDAKPCQKTSVKFHEPTALLVLDSILPKELPPPVAFDEQEKWTENENHRNGDGAATKALQPVRSAPVPGGLKKRAKKMIFGYFTPAEVVIMAIGTLITAAMIFLILELY